jgi:hypothetical protein
MTEVTRSEDIDTASMPIERDSSLPEYQMEAPVQERRHVPNRSVVREQDTIPASYVQVSADIEASADIGVEAYHDRSAASELEPGQFQETRLLTLHEVRQRALEALRRAEERREALREEEAKYTGWADE